MGIILSTNFREKTSWHHPKGSLHHFLQKFLLNYDGRHFLLVKRLQASGHLAKNIGKHLYVNIYTHHSFWQWKVKDTYIHTHTNLFILSTITEKNNKQFLDLKKVGCFNEQTTIFNHRPQGNIATHTHKSSLQSFGNSFLGFLVGGSTTHLKNISQIGSCPQGSGWKINHHLVLKGRFFFSNWMKKPLKRPRYKKQL